MNCYECPNYQTEACITCSNPEEMMGIVTSINPSDMDWINSGANYASTDNGIYPDPDSEDIPF